MHRMLLSVARSSTLMPSSRLPGSPITHPSFSRHRFNEDSRSLPFKINVSIPAPLPSWASLPTPPMSGTPPPESLPNPLQTAGRRRKREDTPPFNYPEPVRAASTARAEISPLDEQSARRHGEAGSAGRSAGLTSVLPAPTLSWGQPPSYGTSIGGASAYALVASSLPPRPPPQVSPRATRKVKAHVASACVNCKRKHLRCDESRPCRRCVQSGKEDTCRDVEHKKRGRPPLKSEGESNRVLSSAISLPPLTSPSGRIGTASGYVPLLPTPTGQRAPYGPSYAASTVAQSSAMASGQFAGSQRPVSFPPSFSHMGHIPPGTSHAQTPYSFAGQAPPPAEYTSTEYPNPLFPRRPALPPQPSHQSHGPYGGPPLQLPPILPAPPRMNMDPAIAQQQQQHYFQPQYPPYEQVVQSGPTQTTQPRRSTEERDPKRPRMDIQGILGPRE